MPSLRRNGETILMERSRGGGTHLLHVGHSKRDVGLPLMHVELWHTTLLAALIAAVVGEEGRGRMVGEREMDERRRAKFLLRAFLRAINCGSVPSRLRAVP